MDVNQFLNLLQQKASEINNMMMRTMPIKAGAIAKAHFQENFRKGGFVNNGLQSWKPAKRLSAKRKSARNNYKTLLSSRNHLFSSIRYESGVGEVKIINDVPYAKIHNEGGTVTIPARTAVLAFRRIKSGKDKGRTRFTKNTAKAHFAQKATIGGHTIMMPKRQFIGESKELNDKVTAKITEELTKILKI